MYSPENFLTATLRGHPRGLSAARILAAAINAVEPGEAVRHHVKREGDSISVAGRTYHLPDYKRVVVISIGKAGWGMAAALSGILAGWPHTGLIVTKHASDSPAAGLSVIEGGHPLPDENSLAAGQRVLDLAHSLTPDDLLFCLISGGGSALVTSPREGISLAEMQALTLALLACGARIDEINTLRRALDQVKGGGLALAANGATIVSLILSDVVGSPLEAIASGPTVPNPTTNTDAFAILEKYNLLTSIPQSIISVLKRPSVEKPSYLLNNPLTHIVASNLLASQAALAQAEREGFHPYLLRTDLQGEAREAAGELINTLRWAAQRGEPVPRPACLVAGGETTVTLRGHGLGGRNQEMALAASIGLADFPNVMLVALATDGEDGPTDAAGAVVTGETWKRARDLGLDPSEFLNRNDSYTFFQKLGDGLRPGPTGTNVNDLVFLFVF
jgi:hydroxypyruvate reductase